MQILLDYLNNPDNRLYVIVLSVTLILLILFSGLTVYAYKRKKSSSEIKPIIPEKAMPEDIVEVLDNMSDSALAEQMTKDAELKNNDTLDNKTLNKLERIAITDETDNKTEVNKEKIEKFENHSAQEKTIQNTEISDIGNANDYKSQPKLAGKWVIVTTPDKKLCAHLETSEGETVLTTETYTSLSGLKSGIDTLKKNIQKDNYAINIDKNGDFVFKIFTSANRILCIGQGYFDRKQCEKAFAVIKSISEHATIENETLHS